LRVTISVGAPSGFGTSSANLSPRRSANLWDVGLGDLLEGRLETHFEQRSDARSWRRLVPYSDPPKKPALPTAFFLDFLERRSEARGRGVKQKRIREARGRKSGWCLTRNPLKTAALPAAFFLDFLERSREARGRGVKQKRIREAWGKKSRQRRAVPQRISKEAGAEQGRAQQRQRRRGAR